MRDGSLIGVGMTLVHNNFWNRNTPMFLEEVGKGSSGIAMTGHDCITVVGDSFPTYHKTNTTTRN